LFAAYADGELEGSPDLDALKTEVACWLAAHPEAAAELAAQHQLRRLCQAAALPEPAEETWQGVLAGIETRLLQRPHRLPLGRVLTWGAGGVAAAVAAVWLALALLPRPAGNPPGPDATMAKASEEPFPVATEEEVEILSVQGDDTGTLVVGQLPVTGPLVLAQPGDVTLHSVRPAADNMVPDVQLQGTGAPMIWSPMGTDRPAP
jgi:hypothetical protein